MRKRYYVCTTRPDWFLIEDNSDSVIVQLSKDSVAIIESFDYKTNNIGFKSISKEDFFKEFNKIAKELIEFVLL